MTGVGADNGSRLAAGGLNNPVVYNRLGTGLSIGQMITDFGRTGNLARSATLRAEAQDQAAESTRAQVLLRTGAAYFGVLRARAVLQVAAQTVAARQLVVDQVSALAESKLKSTLDVSFAKVNLADAKLLQVRAQNESAAAQADLAAAMGLPNETTFDLSEEACPRRCRIAWPICVRQAMADRPDLKDLRLQESAAQRFTRAEHAFIFRA